MQVIGSRELDETRLLTDTGRVSRRPRVLLDTNICIELLRAGSRQTFARIRRHALDDVAISSVTMAELRCGAAKSSRPAFHQMLLVQFFAPLVILPFDHLAAEIYGQVCAALERAGTPIGPLDTLIASHALALDMTLVTTNVREFNRVEGLRVADWRRS